MAAGIPIPDVSGQRLSYMDMVQRSFTQGGSGGGHLIPGAFNELLWGRLGELTDREHRENWVIIPLVHVGRDESVRVLDHFLDLEMACVNAPANELAAKEKAVFDYADSLNRWRYMVPRTLMGSLAGYAYLRFNVLCQQEATAVIIAMRRYCLERGHYPDSLEQLKAEGYLSKLPFDYFAEGPLKYRKVGDDFLLYSGWNKKNDGGGIRGSRLVFGSPSRGEKGDAVYWPLAKPKPAEASSQPN